MRIVSVCLALGLCCAVASADIVISNIDDTSASGTAFGSSATTLYKAAGFTMGDQAYYLDSVSLAIGSATPGSTAHVQIWRGENQPDAMLQDLTDFSFPGGAGVYTWTPNDPITLGANTTYWVYVDNIFEPGDSWNWDSGSTEPSGPAATYAGYIFNGNPSSYLNSYEVNGTPVPEPSCLAMLAMGALVALRRR
jgi:hypothetical protein